MINIPDEICCQHLLTITEGIKDIHIICDLIFFSNGKQLFMYRLKEEPELKLEEELSFNVPIEIKKIILNVGVLDNKNIHSINEFYTLDVNNNISQWKSKEIKEGNDKPVRTFPVPKKDQQIKEIIEFKWSITGYFAILYENNQLDVLMIKDLYFEEVMLADLNLEIDKNKIENDFELIGWKFWTDVLVVQKNGQILIIGPYRKDKGKPTFHFKIVAEKPFGQLKSIDKLEKAMALQTLDKKLIISKIINYDPLKIDRIIDLDESYQSITQYGNYYLTVHTSGKVCLWDIKEEMTNCRELKFKLQKNEEINRIIIRNGFAFIITDIHNLYVTKATEFLTTTKKWIDEEKHWYINEYPDEVSKEARDFTFDYIYASYKDLEKILGKATIPKFADKVTVFWNLKNIKGYTVQLHNWKDTFPLTAVTIEEFLKLEHQEWRISGDKETVEEVTVLLERLLDELR